MNRLRLIPTLGALALLIGGAAVAQTPPEEIKIQGYLTDQSGGGGGLLGRFRRPKATVVEKPFQEAAFQQLIGNIVGRTPVS